MSSKTNNKIQANQSETPIARVRPRSPENVKGWFQGPARIWSSLLILMLFSSAGDEGCIIKWLSATLCVILASTRSFGHSQIHFQFGANLAYAKKIEIKREFELKLLQPFVITKSRRTYLHYNILISGQKRLIMNFNDVFRIAINSLDRWYRLTEDFLQLGQTIYCSFAYLKLIL